MVNRSDLWICFAQLINDVTSVIDAPIVDHKYFVVVAQLCEYRERLMYQSGNRLLIIESRKEDTYTAAAERGKHLFFVKGECSVSK